MPSKKRLTRLEERLQKEAQKLKTQLEKELAPKREPLHLQCTEEDLSNIQLQYQNRLAKEVRDAQNKLDNALKVSGGEIVYKGEYVQAYLAPPTDNIPTKFAPAPAPTPKGKKTASKSYVEKEKTAPPPPSKSPSPPPSTPTMTTRGTRRGGRMSSTVTPKPTPTRATTPPVAVTPKSTTKSSTPAVILNPATSPQIPPSVRPTESTAVGGLATGKPPPLVDLTTDDGRPAPDSREVSFNKLQGKTFPSLVVIARPHLRTKDLVALNDRPSLDAKVKSVLMHTPTKFTEWLIQQGLVRSEQICISHANTKLKLGMYSDVSKFPYSGGYVWISECCPTRFVSVFSGSLFEAASHPPSVLLKLIYHWACQTNVQNIVQWVKVDNFYVKGLFTWLRAACTTALHHHFRLMGGKNKRIEVGVISLGTTTQDGNQRQVKVEVLGILDPEAKQIRLRAVEPLADSDSRNYKKRFSKILEPLNAWVHKDSIIMTDLTVDKSCLNSLGFDYVVQSGGNSSDGAAGNQTVMEYLRRIVPRMFQNTLSLLSRQIIQQFLDELVWREWFGPTAAQAFDNIVIHLAEQTRQNASSDTLIVRLNRIAANPFKNWSFFNADGKVVEENLQPRVLLTPQLKEAVEGNILSTKRSRKRNAQVTAAIEAEQPKPKKAAKDSNSVKTKASKEKSNNNEKDIIDLDDDFEDDVSEKSSKSASRSVSRSKSSTPLPVTQTPNPNGALESYYYGTLEGKDSSTNPKTKITIKCCSCKANFVNNIELLDHLLAHAHNVPSGTNVTQCRFCLAMLPSKDTLDAHIEESHPRDTFVTTGLICVICETRFTTANQLTKHMTINHVAAELPYECGTCLHRTSSHRAAVDHFYENHDGTAMLQCPFCLKSISVWNIGKPYNQNVSFFMQHLQKHQKKGTAKKCNRCALWFVHKGTLKEHQLRSHNSCVGKKNLQMWEPKPSSRGIILARSVNSGSGGKDTLLGAGMPDGMHGHNDEEEEPQDEVFSKMVLVIPDESLRCKECDLDVGEEDHYTGVLKCSKCNYLTCCANAMADHAKSCKDSVFGTVTPAPLISDMYCVCGYHCNDGNVLAKHLAICERKSAYSSLEDAKKAISAHSMLDVLGLVRRPEEINKKAVTENTSPNPETNPNDLTVKEETDIVIEPTEIVDTNPGDVMEILDDDVTTKIETGQQQEGTKIEDATKENHLVEINDSIEESQPTNLVEEPQPNDLIEEQQPMDTTNEASQLVETNVDETLLVETNVDESLLVETNVDESLLVESNVDESLLVETNVDESLLAETNFDENKPVEPNVDENKPAELNVDENKPAELNVDENKPAELNVEETQSVDTESMDIDL